ncbi:hypothetical protein EUX98_g1772 [Antrodiella citrinella]|uniref:Uncharacterized protein n=1 Tax=Antrodiella citrinella TaxID=2447956 RepID=A0A4S4N0M0_9APHY|nr:hypothetical protein EUX98_g1772 [Antrodiella citrinella]
MSNTPTPQPSSGYASPNPSSSAGTPPSSRPNNAAAHAKTKPTNVFSNDGSFLQRFQHLKKDEEEKKKQEEVLARKRQFDSRFKARGKRPSPESADDEAVTESPAKKTKTDAPLTQYEKEVKSYAGRSLKDNGIGVRPLVK